MFGIGSQQNDMLEEQYRIKYLKYKEKYLKLKQHGGFGKTSSGVHCFLTTQALAEALKKDIATLNLDKITEMLHDQAYVVKDGSSEVNLVQKTELSSKLKFWDKSKEPLKNTDKVTNTVVMNRCDDKSIQEIRKAIKKANEKEDKIKYNITKTNTQGLVNRKRNDTSTASHLSHMIVINITTMGKGHTLVGDIRNVRKERGSTESASTESASP